MYYLSTGLSLYVGRKRRNYLNNMGIRVLWQQNKKKKLGLWDRFLVCAAFVFLLVCILCLPEMSKSKMEDLGLCLYIYYEGSKAK